jgi:hypothetical protein
MTESHMILLLQLIHTGGDVNSLLRRGLQFSNIAQLMSKAEADGLIKEEGDTLELTEAGFAKIKIGVESNKQRKDGGWISPLEEFRIDKLSIDDIYLPDSYTIFTKLRRDH